MPIHVQENLKIVVRKQNRSQDIVTKKKKWRFPLKQRNFCFELTCIKPRWWVSGFHLSMPTTTFRLCESSTKKKGFISVKTTLPTR